MSNSAPRITELAIKGFKSIASTTFEPARLNVFIGANGSGKSNVLEAIGLLGCAVSGKVDEEALLYRGVRPGRRGALLAAFRGSPTDTVSVGAQVSRVRYDVTLSAPNGEPSPRWGYRREVSCLDGQPLLDRAEALTQIHSPFRATSLTASERAGAWPSARGLLQSDELNYALDVLERYAIYTPFTPMLRGQVDDPSRREPMGLSGGRLREAFADLGVVNTVRVRKALRELVDWVGDVSAAGGLGSVVLHFQDRHMAEERNWLAAVDVSEGALYALFLLALLAHEHSPRVAAIDNVDNALNPRLARALIEYVQKALREARDVEHERDDRQLFLTVHNPLVLDALDLRDESLTRLFVVERTLGGQTVVTPVRPSDALAKAQAAGATLSQLWVSGALGGVPDL
jgi:predicted ATPase